MPMPSTHSIPPRTRHHPLPSHTKTTSTYPSSPVPQRRSGSPKSLDPPPIPSSNPTYILPGKRGKVARLGLAAMVVFPPVAIVLVALLPVVLFVTVVFGYGVAWTLYATMAGPVSFSRLPLDPRRVWKLNKVVFSVIFSNIGLLPVGLSLIRYRYWTMGGSAEKGLVSNLAYNPLRPDNRMDVHVPSEQARVMDSKTFHQSEETKQEMQLRPVVLFIYGGAWSSGSKWLYTLVGARLRQMGYVVMIPDYSIYPSGKVREMEEDIKMAIQWASRNCRDFGGDRDRIYLMGHSAGAHLCALTVLNDSIKRIPEPMFGSSSSALSSSPILSSLFDEVRAEKLGAVPSLDVLPRLRGMILCSGVFEIAEHYMHEAMRGVEEISAMGRVMGSSEATFRLHSPTNILQELLQVSTKMDSRYPTESQTRHQLLLRHLKTLLPVETLMIHGDMDSTVPVRSSSELYIELKTLQLGSAARLRVIQGMGHEEPVVALMPTFTRENLFARPLMDELSQFIEGGNKVARRSIRRQ